MGKKKDKGSRTAGQRSLALIMTATIVIAVTLVSVSSLLINLFTVTKANEQRFAQKSAEYLSYLKESLEIPLWNYDTAATEKLGRMMMTNDILVSLTITDNQNRELFGDRKPGEADSILMTEEIEYRDTVVGSLKLGLNKKLYRNQQIRIVIFGLLTILAVIICIYGVVTLLVRSFLSKPLNDFSTRIDAIARGEYEPNSKTPSYAELASVMDRFNQMALRIKRREVSLLEANQALKDQIQEREKVERLLRDSEEQYRSLYNNIPVGVFTSTPDGEILSYNPALLKMLNLHDNQEGQYIQAYNFYKRPEDRQAWLHEIAQNKEINGFECEMITAGEKTIWVSITSRAIEEEVNQLRQIHGILVDISDRKKAEKEKEKLRDQLIHSQKMEAIGTLAGGIAHDFNNILGGIIGYGELALMDLSRKPDDKLKTRVDSMLSGSHRAKELVQQILRFSRNQKYIKAPTMVLPIIKEVVKLLKSTIPKTIKIESRMDAARDNVQADASQLHQVFMNLCTNAYHAMRKGGGTLTIISNNITVKEPRSFMGISLAPGEYLCLTFRDTGHGIKAGDMERIFDPYYTTKEVTEGSGLGLSVSLGIIKDHQGMVEVESDPGWGTAFLVYLPII